MSADSVTCFADHDPEALYALLARYGLRVEAGPAGQEIRGSYWGEAEAGLVGDVLVIRGDTPLHSVLHEACHYICMDPERRRALHTDAGGGYDEENAVCYLQIILADQLPQMGRQRMFEDMDAWGYTFRLGSAKDWFERDADDAREWLVERGILGEDDEPSFRKNEAGVL
jgi:hypothetical protein